MDSIKVKDFVPTNETAKPSQQTPDRRFVSPVHTGPEIPGFDRVSGGKDGAYTTVYQSLRANLSRVYNTSDDLGY